MISIQSNICIKNPPSHWGGAGERSICSYILKSDPSGALQRVYSPQNGKGQPHFSAALSPKTHSTKSQPSENINLTSLCTLWLWEKKHDDGHFVDQDLCFHGTSLPDYLFYYVLVFGEDFTWFPHASTEISTILKPPQCSKHTSTWLPTTQCQSRVLFVYKMTALYKMQEQGPLNAHKN